MIITKSTLLIIFSIIYISAMIGIYFAKEREKNEETRIYTYLLITNLFSLIFQILCIIYSYNYDCLNMHMCNFIFKTYSVLFLVYVTYLLIYLVIISFDNYKKIMWVIHTLLNISVVITFLLPAKLYVSPDKSSFYTTGLAMDFVYFVSLVISTSIIAILFIKRKKISKVKTIPLHSFVVLGLVAMIIQKINPELSIMSAVETFLCCMMYFTIENPDLKMIRQLEFAKTRAEKANRAKSDFLSSMSHEIRTPLNAIVGLSEDIASYKDRVPKEVVEDTEDIRNASQTLLEIIGNILDINKIESNKIEIVETTYEPKELIETLAKINVTRIGEKPIHFNMNIAEDLPYELLGDKLHIKEIINNLLSNAFKYTDRGEVTLTVKCINKDNLSNLIISVKDTGRGIKKENIDKLFTKFERLGADRNTTIEGTGLGLAITKNLIEMMGGTINVQSQFGEGSLFVVFLPQKISKMEKPNVEEVKQEVTKEVKDYGHKKILIVDDNMLNIKVARRALSDFNFEIDEATDGYRCLEKVVKGNEYDLILMDIMMPNMGGEETLSKLKENPEFKIPTIALTADAVAGAEEKYKEEGFIDYLAKPFSRNQIKEKLEEIFK